MGHVAMQNDLKEAGHFPLPVSRTVSYIRNTYFPVYRLDFESCWVRLSRADGGGSYLDLNAIRDTI